MQKVIMAYLDLNDVDMLHVSVVCLSGCACVFENRVVAVNAVWDK